MATQQGPARRNGVIGFNMTGAPTPAIPKIAPPRNGPISFQMMPGPSSTASSSSSLINQGPPHRTTPLVGPATAHSSPFSARPSQAQREVSALNEKLSDAEATIYRQEMELDCARSQAASLQSQVAEKRSTTRFVDQQQINAMVHQSSSNRAREFDAQFKNIDDQLDHVSEELERAEGNTSALQRVRQLLEKDRADVQELRRAVAASEYNLQRQKRLAGAEDRVKGLLKNMEKMLAAAMQGTRGSQVQTSKAPIAESATPPVGIARRRAVGCQEPGSQGQAFEPHPQELGKGKERGPRSLGPEDHKVDGYMSLDVDDVDCSIRCQSESPSILSDVMSLDSPRSSRAGSPMDITTEATEQELAAHMLQADEWQVGDRNAAVQKAPATTLTITPQQVETNDMMEIDDQLFCSEIATLNGEDTDNKMEWVGEPAHMITVSNKDDPAAPSQASCGQAPLIPAVNTNADDVLMVAGQISSAVIPPNPANTCPIPISPRLCHTIAEGVAIAWETPKLPSDRARVFKRRDRFTGSRRRYVRQRVIEVVNLPARKRRAGIVGFNEDEGPNCKKRITKEMVEANGSLLLPLSKGYVMNTAPKVPEMSVPAVSQPAQSVHVSTEEVPTQAVMSVPAVSQPAQTALEYTESVMTDQTVMSEPAVSQPTLTVLEYTETVSTEQVPTEAAMSAPAVPKPTQAVLGSTVPVSGGVLEYTSLASTVSIPSDGVVGAPAPSEPAPTKSAQAERSSAEEVLSVPAVTKPTLNESDLTWQTEDELVVPNLRTGTRSHLDVLLAKRAARTQARPTIMSSPEGLQVTATSRIISTSSLVASPEDASVKNAVATGTDSRAGVSKGTERVEDAENPTCSAQQTAGEQRDEMGGEEAATSGLQMPGAWPSDPPAVTASGESDMHEGSALLRGLWTGARWLSFGVFVMVMVMLLSFPLWAAHLGHLAYALEGPEQFLEELRWEHGYDVPFVERIVYVFLRCFAGDRTLFG
ncbi:hypothetical protein LT330_007291 [Penicillium expansum]|uniref:Uncharacterized protein n=1 Tax=Penicillium expansum TaxID=27334 RepID=A0A0A2K571_PENEN|nr:hypothetical protein PEX2_043420 [Penicillium expansum]KAK4868093.1 hypothetical protein LT330_007291 [Penicillium expansum]KGO45682.1 hypothetical protein PEXP_062810 [Penicillium expansum]KGO62819.1 hypothetical protein PEX2_043420 [Penicillium expansum]